MIVRNGTTVAGSVLVQLTPPNFIFVSVESPFKNTFFYLFLRLFVHVWKPQHCFYSHQTRVRTPAEGCCCSGNIRRLWAPAKSELFFTLKTVKLNKMQKKWMMRRTKFNCTREHIFYITVVRLFVQVIMVTKKKYIFKPQEVQLTPP